VRRTVPPSAEIEEQIENLLAVGVRENPRESLSELAQLGSRLIIQARSRTKFDAWLGRVILIQRSEIVSESRRSQRSLPRGHW
jgi:hypothetical protein